MGNKLSKDDEKFAHHRRLPFVTRMEMGDYYLPAFRNPKEINMQILACPARKRINTSPQFSFITYCRSAWTHHAPQPSRFQFTPYCCTDVFGRPTRESFRLKTKEILSTFRL